MNEKPENESSIRRPRPRRSTPTAPDNKTCDNPGTDPAASRKADCARLNRSEPSSRREPRQSDQAQTRIHHQLESSSSEDWESPPSRGPLDAQQTHLMAALRAREGRQRVCD